MPTHAIAVIDNTTPLGRRVNAALSAGRSLRDALAGLDRDVAALFGLSGFDPAAPGGPDPAAAEAVAAALGMPDPSHLGPALVGLVGLRALDLTAPLSRFTSPVG